LNIEKCTFYQNEHQNIPKKNYEVCTARSININFECGPQVEKKLGTSAIESATVVILTVGNLL